MARESKRRRDERRFGRADRLADIAINTPVEGWAIPPSIREMSTPCVERVRRDLADVPVVSAENVKDYFFEHPKGDWTYKDDFPCVAPPFPRLFVEFGKPRRVVIGDEVIQTDPTCPDRIGFLFEFADAAGKLYPKPTRSGALAPFDMAELPDARWFARALPVSLTRGKPTYLSFIKMFAVDGGGAIVQGPDAVMSGMPLDAETLEELDFQISQFFMPALLTLCFMNCRNTAISAVEPDAALNRERQRAGLRPFVRYHTINIEPMKSVLRTEGNVEANGLARALHICRGHFARYTEDRPLFGHFVGTVWRPAHVRGSARAGVVVSDYEVSPR